VNSVKPFSNGVTHILCGRKFKKYVKDLPISGLADSPQARERDVLSKQSSYNLQYVAEA